MRVHGDRVQESVVSDLDIFRLGIVLIMPEVQIVNVVDVRGSEQVFVAVDH